MVKQAVILCGGRGTRLNDSLRYQPVEEVPKPLVEVGGKSFVTYAVNMLKGVGIEDIILLVGYMKEKFEFLQGIRLVETQEDINKAVLNIPDLRDFFLLLNGDCFPVMDWRAFCALEFPTVAIKIIERDAGVALVDKSDVEAKVIDCSDIKGMADTYDRYTILGGLHIGTYQGLARARLFMDTIVFGQ